MATKAALNNRAADAHEEREEEVGGYAKAPRLAVAVLAVVGACAVLVLRLWRLQVAEGEAYAAKLRGQTTLAIQLLPARGPVVDRNGIPLAENRPSFDMDLYLDELVRYYSRQHRGRVPFIEVERRAGEKILRRKEPDVARIVSEYLEPITRTLNLSVPLDPKELQRHYYQTPNVPYHYLPDIDFRLVAQFSERNLGIPGISIAPRPVRYYRFGALAPHILGYVGEPADREQLLERMGYVPDMVGREGVEKIFDSQLQGEPGGRILRVNSRGYILSEEAYRPPHVGGAVYLTLDARIQAILEAVLRKVGRATAIVMDPWTGDILAMASVPNYDPNVFIPKVSPEEWKRLTTDPTAPLVNRAISPYAPGSTFKVLVALAALKYGVITPKTKIYSPGGIDIGGRVFKDWTPGGRGDITVYDGIRYSCNTFFYQVGIRTGIDRIVELGRVVGFGAKTGIPLNNESPGILPDPAWMKVHYPRERWTIAHTANVSIGQGFLQVTPLQMTVLMAAVANGGTVLYPRLVHGVMDWREEVKASIPVRVRGELGVRQEDLDALRAALRGVVESGTGHSVDTPHCHVAGKTGSAQFKRWLNGKLVKDTRAWFYGYFPYEKPRYVFTVMVEGGVSGGSTAGPLAREIVEKILQLEQSGQAPDLGYFRPAVGNFNGVTEVGVEERRPSVEPAVRRAVPVIPQPVPPETEESEETQ